jgi:hypothetical protein
MEPIQPLREVTFALVLIIAGIAGCWIWARLGRLAAGHQGKGGRERDL